jgi:hypothetical protein
MRIKESFRYYLAYSVFVIQNRSHLADNKPTREMRGTNVSVREVNENKKKLVGYKKMMLASSSSISSFIV